MTFVDIVALAVLLLIVGMAIAYIVREKRRGVRCIGCPAGKSCSQSGKAVGIGGCSCGAMDECPASKMAASLRVSE